ncbi:hypothetical protein VTN00DRAFT_7633 [Thermoascus crustaceus]|uniref:uncharacterized protein n=1 Tax=Thermoascus crustaceus TaxID=5088 RepID=UPI003742B6E4
MWLYLFTGIVVLAHLEVAFAQIDYSSIINQSMCTWEQPRVNIIRDTIYLDGGYLWWQLGKSDGQYGIPQSGGLDNRNGNVYELSLRLPFDTKSTNLTKLFTQRSQTGELASSGLAPGYRDGVMFANDGEYIVYGGATALTDSQAPPPPDRVIAYEAYQWGPEKPNWKAGFYYRSLPSNVTTFVTDGAGVSAPSENLGFYFSGMHAKDWGPCWDDNESANITANTLVTVDMSVMREETWKIDTLPDDVPGRASAELVWIPVSESGILIAIGGVIYPESWESHNLTASQKAESKKTSPTFMQTLPVYDVANKRWYMQNTTGDIPPQLTLFCSVVAAATDGSSYNVYIYGGYDGLDLKDPPSDDVYILSVPSFTWIKAYTGEQGHGRSGHKCVKVYPDQMFVLGGINIDPTRCVGGGIIQVFNLNSLRFQDSYNPEHWSPYEVPALVTAQIGGDSKGGATKTAPSSWNDDALRTVFSSKYTKPIQTYYPYKLASSTSTPSTVPKPDGNSHGSGLPNWVGPVLGVILALIVIAALVIGWFLYRRRRYKSTYGSTTSDGANSRMRIFKWISGTHVSPPRGSTIATSTELGANEKHFSGGTLSDGGASGRAKSPSSGTYEAGSLQVHELDSNTGGRVELATDYNSAENQSPLRQASYSPSLDGVLSTQDQQPGDRTSATSSNDSRPSRPTHQHHHSDLSSPLSDISEDPTEDLTRPRYVSGLSDILVSPEEQKPEPLESNKSDERE